MRSGSPRPDHAAGSDGDAPGAGERAFAAGFSPYSGYGPAGAGRGRTNLQSTEAVGHGHRRAAALRILVTHLRGCLASLPAELRKVLQLRSGVGERRALTRVVLARVLHLTRSHLARLEARALRALRAAAAAGDCARATTPASTTRFADYRLADYQLPASLSGAAVGVKGARYEKAASGAGGTTRRSRAGTSAPFGIPATLHSVVGIGVLLLAGLAGGLAIVLLLADELGMGRRSRRWRHRWAAAMRGLKRGG